jgi:hypothetical protein
MRLYQIWPTKFSTDDWLTNAFWYRQQNKLVLSRTRVFRARLIFTSKAGAYLSGEPPGTRLLGPIWGAQNLTIENLKVVQAEFSSLYCAVSAWHNMQPLLELKTLPRVHPVSYKVCPWPIVQNFSKWIFTGSVRQTAWQLCTITCMALKRFRFQKEWINLLPRDFCIGLAVGLSVFALYLHVLLMTCALCSSLHLSKQALLLFNGINSSYLLA